MYKIVGIGECIFSNNIADIIKTFALGSCVAMTIYCPVKKLAGMVHIALPYPGPAEKNDNSGIYYYAATAVPQFVSTALSLYKCFKKDIRIELFGGADSLNHNDYFKIGRRNLKEISRVLTEMGIPFIAQEIGGKISRTVQIEVATGFTEVKTQSVII